MRKITLLLLLFAGMANAQIVTIPDANFKAKLLSASASNGVAQGAVIDTNGDGEIQVSEAAAIQYLDVQNANIANLTGITDFINLQLLYCSNNQLTSLDLPGMELLQVIIADHNQISTVNVNGCFNLEILECSYNQLTTLALNGQGLSSLRGLSVGYNQLTSINVSGISSLENYSAPYNQLTAVSVAGMVNLKSVMFSGNQLTTFSISNLLNMEIAYLDDNNLTSLTFNGALNSFNQLYCGQNELTTLNVSNMPNLVWLNCPANKLTSINTTGLTSLKEFNCSSNKFTSLNINGLTSLVNFNADINLMTSFSVNGLNNLAGIGISDNQLTSLNLSNLPVLKQLGCYKNQLTTLDVTNLPSLEILMCNYNQMNSLTVNGMPNLQRIFCGQNQLASINLNNLPNLDLLWADDNLLTSLDVTGLSNLTQLTCANNQLTQLDVNGLANLTYLWCPNNDLTTLEINNLTNLLAVGCSNNMISALDVAGLVKLTRIECQNNSIPALNVTGMVDLIYLMAGNNQLTTIDVNGLPSLKQLDVSFNQLTTLDASDCHNLTLGISAHNNQLQTLFLKNGFNEGVTFGNNPDLAFICADESQVGDLQLAAEGSLMPDVVISSYCSFTPGGDYNTISGVVRFDENNNGCDALDVTGYNVRFDLTGPVSSGTFANTLGNYKLYTEAGNYTLNAHLENPAYFNMTPTTANFNFPAVDNSEQTQNFCLTANGAHPDLEIVLMPFGMARPGFDATYLIVYKNKGNQTLSGTVNLVFGDSRTDFISAEPAVANQSPNSLIWNFSNLHPFETRSIQVVLNVNSPVENPAVNDGDFLDFTSSINFATGDDTPDDNISTLHQLVVNSMDPNAKTCLDGETISPENIGKYLHYNIEFENLGTAEAINVVVRDVIDTTKFDINSLQVMYSSHPMRAVIRENTIEFVFEDINLAAASGNPPVGGHGNVLFKIKTLPTLAEGDHVENKADIFFDYNHPIETNTARTTFILLGNPDFEDNSVAVYPNPVKNNVNITCDSMIESIELFDVQGRMLRTAIVNGNTANLDMSDKSNGIYLIRITSDKGQKVVKLVKE